MNIDASLTDTLNFLIEQDSYNCREAPKYITNNIAHTLRDYQTEALARFRYYINDYEKSKISSHLLFHMATGSGKTIVMAGCILELYKKGYRNFLFFVNSDNIIDKTKHNLLYQKSNKYLFNKDKIIIGNDSVAVKVVDNFNEGYNDSINICFNTIQKLHGDLINPNENGISIESFKGIKVAIISDEAHHINSMTKKARSKKESREKQNWEKSALGILKANDNNIMLEFTATMNMENEAIAKKYNDKVIYDYTFLKFNADKYSKNVFTLASTFDNNYKILQAIILSQYRLKLAGYHKVNPPIKPVILVKSQERKIMRENYNNFNRFLSNLKVSDLIKIKDNSKSNEIKAAFKFFKKNKITNENLVLELQPAFNIENSVITDSTESSLNAKILVNTLEDKENKVRIIFVVNQLNEGWDAVNLYDIVRLYNIKSKKITTAEAQLIGRGARYCPFTTNLNKDKYKRKFNVNTNNELSILEEFYFHCENDSIYISKLKTELKTQGIILKKENELPEIKSKENLTKPAHTKIKIENFNNVLSFIENQPFKYECTIENDTSNSKDNLLETNTIENTTLTTTLDKNNFSKQIIQTAFDRDPYFNFDKIKKYCGDNINSMNDFENKIMENLKINITYRGDKNQLLNPYTKLNVFCDTLQQIKKTMKERTNQT